MKQVIETIVKGLVDNKEAVDIQEIENEDSIIYKVKVDSKDMGKVIGKQGRIARAIRIVMKSVATREHKKVTVEFID